MSRIVGKPLGCFWLHVVCRVAEKNEHGGLNVTANFVLAERSLRSCPKTVVRHQCTHPEANGNTIVFAAGEVASSILANTKRLVSSGFTNVAEALTRWFLKYGCRQTPFTVPRCGPSAQVSPVQFSHISARTCCATEPNLVGHPRI